MPNNDIFLDTVNFGSICPHITEQHHFFSFCKMIKHIDINLSLGNYVNPTQKKKKKKIKDKHFCIRSLANPENREIFGMVISYTVKVKLYLGAMGGEVTAELPFVLMHPKVSHIK